MTAHDFLAAVLPPPGHGYYCAAEFTTKKKQHVFVEDVKEIEPLAKEWLDKKIDVYFALATFKDNNSREAENVQCIRTVAIDMDGYTSKKAAAEALDKFLQATQLDAFGLPWIIGSGGGLHCYWIFDAPVTVDVWRPMAENLKRLCRKQQLSIDMSVTADAARVLRVPGTANFKKKYGTPRPVTSLSTSSPIKFAEFDKAIKDLLGPSTYAPPPAALMLPGTKPTKVTSASSVKLMENSTTKFRTIMMRTGEGDGCAQLAHYMEHAHEEGMEPLWRAWLSQAKYCSDGDKASKWLSELHPYDEDRMHTKLREIKGPYPCIKFDSENPGICEGCKYFGKITNPLYLGREIVTDNTSKEIEVPAPSEDPEAGPTKVMRPTPPKGYSYGVNGGVFVERMVEEADGTKRKKDVMLLPYDLFVVDLLNKDNEHTVHLVANRPGNAVDILMPQRSVVSKDECIKALAQQNILASYGSGNDKNLHEYVRACVEEASITRQVIKIPGQFGWQEDNSFVYAGRIFFPNGDVRTVPMPDLVNITRNTRSQGKLEEWRKLPQLLVKRQMYDILGVMALSFGAPLMRFTQMSCMTMHAGSTESGLGKSLALNLINSVWGHPQRYRTGKSTSSVTMQQRIGNLNSLPFTSDEITSKSRQEMEWFPGLIFDLAEGQGKEKSEVHNNRERINLVAWATLAYFTSNMLMYDYMSGARSHTSQAELLRMLEWSPEVKLNWTSEEEEILKVLHSNHGVAGEKYVRWLVLNQDLAKRIHAEVTARIKKEWRTSGDERYWVAGCASIITGAILAGRSYADVFDFPVEEIIEFYKGLVEKARKVVRNSGRTAEDILNMFTRDNYGQFVVMRVSNGSLTAALGSGQTIDQTITRNKVMGRVEHEVTKPGYVEYFIEEQILKSHCVSLSFGYDMFKRQVQAIPGYVIQYVRKDMLAKTKGPQMRVRAISISRPIEADNEVALGEN